VEEDFVKECFREKEEGENYGEKKRKKEKEGMIGKRRRRRGGKEIRIR
jgi:hypothetical protein